MPSPRRRLFLSVSIAAGIAGIVGAGVVACGGAKGAAIEAPVDIAIPPIGTGNGIAADGGVGRYVEGAGGAACSVRLALVGKIEKSSPGCYLDELITKVPGVLRFPCSGYGAIEVDFGDHHYTGHVSGGDVELEMSTELDWEDGCRWGTHSVITGPLVARGAPILKNLTWRYRDHVIDGTACSGVCVATANIQVTPAAGDGSGSRIQLHDDTD